MKNCPRCASELSPYAKLCPRCGLPVSQMEEFIDRFNLAEKTESSENGFGEVDLSQNKKERKAAKKQAKKAAKKAKKERESKSDTDFKQFASNGENIGDDSYLDSDTFSERKRKRKNKLTKPVFDLDENGEFNIDTSDVEIVGAETGKIIEERFEQSYSVKKQRGDYRPPKIKWWEIYKISDRYFARRKIKKEVAKAARIKPSFISKAKLLLLAIFFGWTGAHNFYAKNKKKGWVSVATLIIWVGVSVLAREGIAFFRSIEISVAGFAGFINVLIWITDIINIIFNKFKYRLQIDKFISEMNVETRAKLGEKYIDLDLYHKPWWVRFKVWCQKKKRNYAEYKRDRRQANIDKQKRKAEAQAEKDKIDSEIYDFEQKENIELEKKKQEVLEKEAAIEINATANNTLETESNNLENLNKENLDEKAATPASIKKKGSSAPVKKYTKTVKNTKAANKKKKK